MNDVILNIKLNFEKETISRESFKTLKAALSDYDDDLSKSLDTIKSLSKEEVDTEIIVLDISRKRKIISIKARADSIDTPIFLLEPFVELGSIKTSIRETSAEGGNKNHYFLGAKKVTKKEHDAYQIKKKLSAKDRKINAGLFLPEGRVSVKATLVDFVWAEGFYGEFCAINMLTEDGKPIVYRGTSEALTKLTEDEYENVCEFDAVFERKKIAGEYISLVKRPTKVKINKK